MNLHAIFKDIFTRPEADGNRIVEFINLMQDARAEFQHVGVEFTYETFKQWFQRTYSPFPSVTPSPAGYRSYETLWKIIEGDNLDIIEDVAKDKGLI